MSMTYNSFLGLTQETGANGETAALGYNGVRRPTLAHVYHVAFRGGHQIYLPRLAAHAHRDYRQPLDQDDPRWAGASGEGGIGDGRSDAEHRRDGVPFLRVFADGEGEARDAAVCAVGRGVLDHLQLRRAGADDERRAAGQLGGFVPTEWGIWLG